MPVEYGVGRTIRDYLKAGTAAAHDQLDSRLGTLVGGSASDYSAFLDIQYRARLGIEQWLALECRDTAPPPQTGLIARDLADLGHDIPDDTPAFAAPTDARALGVCWVLAGSALGNRMILSRMAKHAEQRPTAFLSDRRMGEYWRSLLPALGRSATKAEADALLASARASFAHFNAVAAASPALEAA